MRSKITNIDMTNLLKISVLQFFINSAAQITAFITSEHLTITNGSLVGKELTVIKQFNKTILHIFPLKQN